MNNKLKNFNLIGSVAKHHFYCNFHISATTLQKFFTRYSVYASKFLLRLARNLKISLRKRVWQQTLNQGGFALLLSTVVILSGALSLVSAYLLLASAEIKTSQAKLKSLQSYYASESGLEDAIYRVKNNLQYSSSYALNVGQNSTNVTIGVNQAEVTVESQGAAENRVRKVRTVFNIPTTTVGFSYGSQIGDGGLDLGQNSRINGSVYSNGNITGENGTRITGNTWVAATSLSNVIVDGNAYAHTMDDVTVGGSAEAFNFEDGTVGGNVIADNISDCTIGGNASYNTKTSCIIGGNQITPVTPPSDPAAQNMPITQEMIDNWKAQAEAGGVINGNCGDNGVSGCDIPSGGSLTLGPKKIDGNLILNNNQTLTVSGTIYVTGYIDIDNGSSIQLSSSYGTNSGLVFSDGTLHLANNGVFTGSGQAGSYLMLMTLVSGGGHHDSAIDIHNNATGVIFYAPNGLVNLHQNVNATQITAKKISLSNNAAITYDPNLANALFSGGGSSGTFQVKTWQEIE